MCFRWKYSISFYNFVIFFFLLINAKGYLYYFGASVRSYYCLKAPLFLLHFMKKFLFQVYRVFVRKKNFENTYIPYEPSTSGVIWAKNVKLFFDWNRLVLSILNCYSLQQNDEELTYYSFDKINWTERFIVCRKSKKTM